MTEQLRLMRLLSTEGFGNCATHVYKHRVGEIVLVRVVNRSLIRGVDEYDSGGFIGEHYEPLHE